MVFKIPKPEGISSRNWLPIQRMITGALAAVDPYEAVKRNLFNEQEKLFAGEETIGTLSSFKRIILLGIGKASIPMTIAAAEFLSEIPVEGIVITKHISEDAIILMDKGIDVIESSHPIPDRNSVLAADRVLNTIGSLSESDLVIGLISGGGSSLVTAPIDGIPLTDIQVLTQTLLDCGADIKEINTIRKHLSRIKGGQLAKAVFPARMVNLILSDVIGDNLDMIASGPAAPDPTTFHESIEILRKYEIQGIVHSRIYNHLNSGSSAKIPETPKPGDEVFENVSNIIVGNNFLAAREAEKIAIEEGFNTLLLTSFISGEAQTAGENLSEKFKQIIKSGDPISRPACIIIGGESTVTIRGTGLGGRNLELALGALEGFSKTKVCALITLATDGDDGPTDAAGALVTSESLDRAEKIGLNWVSHLENNDSYPFFQKLGDLIITGPTHTNVNDLVFLFAF